VAESNLKSELLRLDGSEQLKQVVDTCAFRDDDPIAETKRKFSELCEEFALGMARPKIEPLIKQKVDELDIQAPAVGGEVGATLAASVKVPSKEEIAELAVELCETFTRKHVSKMFIKAYNATETKLIDVVGLGGSSSADPEAEARDVSFLNPMSDMADPAATAQSMLSKHTGMDVEGLKGQAAGLIAEAEGMKGQVSGLSAEAEGMKGQVSGLSAEAEGMRGHRV
jgi:hypothetical protein